MNAFETLRAAWHANHEIMAGSRAFKLMASATITPRQYAAILRQVFHNVRENAQLMTTAAGRFRGPQRTVVKTLLRHAVSEAGHELLALHDIEALGEDISQIPLERPLPSSFALRASVAHMIEHHEPVAIVGYMFQLEYTPVQLGQAYMEALERAGIPRNAMTFIEEHASVDVSHCKLIEQYCEALLRTPEELEAALYMQRLTAELYARMLDEAIDSAERWDALSMPNPEECISC